MREFVVHPPPNPPPCSFRQARTFWLIVCGFTAFSGFLLFEYYEGRLKAEVSALWLIGGLNIAGHAALIPLMIYARRWEEINRQNILKHMAAITGGGPNA
jgi:hypothetical protein